MKVLEGHIKNVLCLNKSKKNIIMIRHGQSMGNYAGTIVGWTDVRLSNKGRAEANSLFPALYQHYNKFDGIYSSDLMRCVDTANLALGFPNNTVKTDKRLRELMFGKDEGKHFDSLTAAEKEKINSIDYHPEGGESWPMAIKRFSSAISELQNGNYLIFSHGGLMCALTWNLGIKDVLPNCSAIGLEINEQNLPYKLLFSWLYPQENEL